MVKSFKIFIELLSNVISMSFNYAKKQGNPASTGAESNPTSTEVGNQKLTAAQKLRQLSEQRKAATATLSVPDKTPTQLAVENAISSRAHEGSFKSIAQKGDQFGSLREFVTSSSEVSSGENVEDSSENSGLVVLPHIDRSVALDPTRVKNAQERARKISRLEESIKMHQSTIGTYEAMKKDPRCLISQFEGMTTKERPSDKVIQQLELARKQVEYFDSKISELNQQIEMSKRMLSEVPKCVLTTLYSGFTERITRVDITDGTLINNYLHDVFKKVNILIASLKSSGQEIDENNALPKGQRKAGLPHQPMTRLLQRNNEKLIISSSRYSRSALCVDDFNIVVILASMFFSSTRIFHLKWHENAEITVSLVSGDVQPSEFEKMEFFISLEATLNQILEKFNDGAKQLGKREYTLEEALSKPSLCATIFAPKLRGHFSDEQSCETSSHSSKPASFTQAEMELADKLPQIFLELRKILNNVRFSLGGLSLNTPADLKNQITWGGKENMERAFDIMKTCDMSSITIEAVVEFLSAHGLISTTKSTITTANGKRKEVYLICDHSHASSSQPKPAPAASQSSPAQKVLSLREESANALRELLARKKEENEKKRRDEEEKAAAAAAAAAEEKDLELKVLETAVQENRQIKRAVIQANVDASRARLAQEKASGGGVVPAASELNAANEKLLQILQARLRKAAEMPTNDETGSNALVFLRNLSKK
jgi:hypothetical protein